jgi:hypothetical protein
MNKLKFLILSIIVILVFGGLRESHAQFSFTNGSCRTSFMSPTINNWSSSSPSLTFAQYETGKRRSITVEKILNVPVGVAIGSLCGFVIGAAIPEDNFGDAIKGVLIGAIIGPFYTFEIMWMSKKVKNPSHKWYFTAGGNLTLANYAAFQTKPGYSIGIRSQYHLTDRIGLHGEAFYTLREFFLPSQKICYSYHYINEIRAYAMDFSVSYIDISLLLDFKLFKWRKSTSGIALGPSFALEVFDNTRYHLIKAENDQNDFNFVYNIDKESNSC